MTGLYTVAEVISATGGRAQNITATHISSISIDSREVAPDALFVAIKGDRFDGHDFVATAIKNGAVVALVSEAHAGDLGDLPLIVVPDALNGLENLAREARARSAAKIIAVTGSAGKTTTKEAIRAVLSAHGKTHASIKSFNNHWGVPLMLARMPEDTEFGVFEIGMSAKNEISPLSSLVRPHIALITTVAPAHLENFASLDEIAGAKAEIFDGLGQGGSALLNIDHPCADILIAAAKNKTTDIKTYGFDNKADIHIEMISQTQSGTKAQVTFAPSVFALDLTSVGAHRLANAVAALSVAIKLGIDPASAIITLQSLDAPDGRGAITRFGSKSRPLVLIDESYNANPASMVAALDVFTLQTASGGAKTIVIGEMLELGMASENLHAQLKDSILKSGATKVFLVGNNMTKLISELSAHVEVVHAKAVHEINDAVLNSLDYGDAIMIKGSNSVKLSSLVSHIRDRFEA